MAEIETIQQLQEAIKALEARVQQLEEELREAARVERQAYLMVVRRSEKRYGFGQQQRE